MISWWRNKTNKKLNGDARELQAKCIKEWQEHIFVFKKQFLAFEANFFSLHDVGIVILWMCEQEHVSRCKKECSKYIHSMSDGIYFNKFGEMLDYTSGDKRYSNMS
jgi:hypothetical protein